MRLTSALRAAGALTLALLPNAVKLPLYRWLYGYKIGRDVRIGFTLIQDVARLEIGDHCRIGHFNRFRHVPLVCIGSYTTIGHFNQFISSTEFTNAASLAQRGNAPMLLIGEHVGISARHYFDIEDTISIGAFTTLGGLNTVLFTHGVDVMTSRQSAKAISIGAYSMVGSNVLFHPGSGIADRSVVGMGSVVTRRFVGSRSLIGGNPAKLFGPLPESAKYFHRRVGWIGSFTTPPIPTPEGKPTATPPVAAPAGGVERAADETEPRHPA